MKLFTSRSSIKCAIFCLHLLILQSTFYSNFFVNSIPLTNKVKTEHPQKPEDPKHEQKSILFTLHLAVPADLEDGPTIAFVNSAIHGKNVKLPRLHYDFPHKEVGATTSGFLTSTDEKIKTMKFAREQKPNALVASYSFNPFDPEDQYNKRVGMYLIAELLSKTHIVQHNHQTGPDEEHLKRLDAKLTQSGLHGELPTTNTGGDFKLEIFNEKFEQWRIVLKHETLSLVSAQIGEDTVKLVIQSVTGLQKVHIEDHLKQQREQVLSQRAAKNPQSPQHNTHVVKKQS